jgi:hypothetical protein
MARLASGLFVFAFLDEEDELFVSLFYVFYQLFVFLVMDVEESRHKD